MGLAGCASALVQPLEGVVNGRLLLVEQVPELASVGGRGCAVYLSS